MMTQIVEKVHREYEKFRPDALFQLDEALLTAEKIVKFISQKDAEQAAEAMQAHLELVTTELRQKLHDYKWIRKSA
jgi:DNA-binding FadR family transcriptional regulator